MREKVIIQFIVTLLATIIAGFIVYTFQGDVKNIFLGLLKSQQNQLQENLDKKEKDVDDLPQKQDSKVNVSQKPNVSNIRTEISKAPKLKNDDKRLNAAEEKNNQEIHKPQKSTQQIVKFSPTLFQQLQEKFTPEQITAAEERIRQRVIPRKSEDTIYVSELMHYNLVSDMFDSILGDYRWWRPLTLKEKTAKETSVRKIKMIVEQEIKENFNDELKQTFWEFIDKLEKESEREGVKKTASKFYKFMKEKMPLLLTKIDPYLQNLITL